MSLLGIAAIQLEGARTGNLELIEREVSDVCGRFPWVDLVTFGELAIHGPSKDHAEPAGGETEQRLCALARETGRWLIPGSLYELRGEKVFNTSPVIDPYGNVIGRYDKMFPFCPYEAEVEYGEDFSIFEIPGAGRIGVVICYDIWYPEIVRTMAAMGAETIIVPTMTNTIDREVELAIARANAAVSQVFFISVNVAGMQGNGRSAVYGPGGEPLYEAGTGRDVIALELDFSQVHRVRERGWHGLGQVLKSFRDSPVSFPLHGDVDYRRQVMKELGPLEIPRARSGRSAG